MPFLLKSSTLAMNVSKTDDGLLLLLEVGPGFAAPLLRDMEAPVVM